MDISAAAQAKSRLLKAQKAITTYKAATSFEEAEEAWTDFLIATSAIYSKLEQGAKGFGESEAWYGRKKKERKDDPLLRYLHYARNSNEHGIERVVAIAPDTNNLPRKLKFNERVELEVQFPDPDGKLAGDSGEWHKGIISGPTLKPIRAHDTRFHDYCDPPKVHQEKPIPFEKFLDKIGEVALDYLREMVTEAESLGVASSKIIAR